MRAIRQEDLGQLLFLRLRENRWGATVEKALRVSPPGGVHLGEPLPRSMAATREFVLKVARALPRVPFLAVREEGGTHDPLTHFLPALPSPRAAAGKELSAVALVGNLIGEALSLLGLNTNLAPLLDLATPLTERKLRARAFGADARRVADCGGAFLHGLERHKIFACGKHFPGWGSVPLEDATGLPVSGKPMAALWSEDLVPFKKLLPQLPMVLMSNAAYKAYDFDHPRPASLSAPVVEGLLRIKLGFRGLALSYDLDLPGVRGTLGFGEAVVQSLAAGCDMVVVDQGQPFESARWAIQAALESGRLAPQRVGQAIERIRAARKRIRMPSGKFSWAAAERLRRRFESFAKGFTHKEAIHA